MFKNAIKIRETMTISREAAKIPDSSFRQMVEQMPVNVMLCDLDFTIIYVNESTRTTLRKIEHVLPVKVDRLIGSSIDVFHKNPMHQRRMLADPKNLPHKARITIGGEVLDLLVTAITDTRGRYLMPMLTWQLVTDQVRIENETARLMQMVDNMPTNVMMCDRDVKINYINKTSIETLRPLQHLLRVPVDQILGASIDVFHKNPAHQRSMLMDPKNLPHRAKIKLGDEILDLRVSALTDKNGEYLAPMLTWSVITSAVKLSDSVKGLVSTLSSLSGEMQATAQRLADAAEQTSEQSAAVASASEQLTSSVSEISRQLTDCTRVVDQAVTEATNSERMVSGLVEAAGKIGSVSDVVAQIAGQDQPAGSQCHDRSGPRRRCWKRLRGGRVRSQIPRQPDRQGNGRDRGSRQGHSGSQPIHRARHPGDRRHHQQGEPDQHVDLRRGRAAVGGDQRGDDEHRGRPAGGNGHRPIVGQSADSVA
ncbi:PAS domain-containing protein [Bradyrhizobium sp. USDA 4353]